MAEAPGHRLGQIIGDALERCIEPVLADFAAQHSLYLDKRGPRSARPGLKMTWEDSLGNKHDLDYVLERGGTDDEIGLPLAFIETAWRRYTKHSRNKAQEIQGAVLPLVAKYSHTKPFAGVVLAGVFTKGSLDQLESNGFAVLYAPYETIIGVFAEFGMDVQYDEGTPDDHLQDQIDVWDNLSDDERDELGEALSDAVGDQVEEFIERLGKTILRKIVSVSVLPLHGDEATYDAVNDAIAYLEKYSSPGTAGPLVRFEVIVRYDNDDRIVADFAQADSAIQFLQTFTS